MIASVHMVDLGAREALAAVRKGGKALASPGLRSAEVALAAPLSSAVLPSPQLDRIGIVAFWDNDAVLDCFLDSHPMAKQLATGWHVRLAPVRLRGAWPGVPDDLSQGRGAGHDEPAVVLTLGRLRLSQTLRFLRSSAKAQGAVIDAPGLTWGTGLARPPFVATCSLWESTEALAQYAYGQDQPAHIEVIRADEAKPFHHLTAFVRFRPISSVGRLDGRNPLPSTWMAPS